MNVNQYNEDIGKVTKAQMLVELKRSGIDIEGTMILLMVLFLFLHTSNLCIYICACVCMYVCIFLRLFNLSACCIQVAIERLFEEYGEDTSEWNNFSAEALRILCYNRSLKTVRVQMY